MSPKRPAESVLSEYIDGELSAAERRELEAALAADADLIAQLARIRELDRAVEELPVLEPSPQFEARFWARLAREQEARPMRRLAGALRRGLSRPLGWSLGGLAAAAGVALALMLRAPAALELEPDWQIVADAEEYELLQTEDLDMLEVLEILEAWNGTQEI